MKKNLFLLLCAFNSFIYAQEFPVLIGDYLGQTLPNDTPIVFAPGIVSTDSIIQHSAPAFSPDGNEVFWWVVRSPKTSNEKWTSWGMTMRRVEGRWTAPEVTKYYGGTTFSIDGKRLYIPGLYPERKPNGPYYIEKRGDKWSESRNLGIVARFPELKGASGFSITYNGTLYFNGDTVGNEQIKDINIYRAKLVDGEYTKLELLPHPINMYPYQNMFSVIAPDESYLIFTSNRLGNFGGGDLYISFHDMDSDKWTDPINMGEPINSRMDERFPGLSADGKYLFFTRLTRVDNQDFDHDIFWVNTEIINRLREKYNILKETDSAQTIQWTQKQSLPNAYRNGNATTSNGKIYYMGGYCDATPERFERANYEYDPATEKWTAKAGIPSGRSNFAMTEIRNKIYVIGGDPFSPKNEVYNQLTDSWDSLRPMLTPRQHISCAVVDGKIYVAGGLMNVQGASIPSKWGYENITNINEMYDPSTNRWESRAPMPTKRHGAFMAAVNGKIYVIGGMGDATDMWKTLSAVEMYDPQTDQWETKKSLPEPRDGFGISVIDNQIFVIGGFSGSATVSSVYVYDTETDQWSASTDFPNIENGSSACAAIENKIYIMGGCDKNYKANGNTFIGCNGQEFTDLYGEYLGQTPPGDIPEIFAPGVISGTRLEHSSTVFSSDGKEVYWASRKDQTDKIAIWYMKRINNRWTQPQAFEPFPDSSGCYDPFLSNGNNRLYFGGDGKSSDIWYVDRQKDGWGTPQNIGPLINSDNGQCQATLTKYGTVYFIDYKTVNDKWTCDIMRSTLKNGAYTEPEQLPAIINTAYEDWTPFVAPDDSYLIFASYIARKDNPSAYSDLYISFHDTKNDIWSEPVNMGASINTYAQETYPVVSPDGKYLFFTRWTDDKNDMDVYWVNASIIEKLCTNMNKQK